MSSLCNDFLLYCSVFSIIADSVFAKLVQHTLHVICHAYLMLTFSFSLPCRCSIHSAGDWSAGSPFLLPGVSQLSGGKFLRPSSLNLSLSLGKTNLSLEYTTWPNLCCLDQHSSSPDRGERSGWTGITFFFFFFFFLINKIRLRPHYPVTMVLSQRQRDEL